MMRTAIYSFLVLGLLVLAVACGDTEGPTSTTTIPGGGTPTATFTPTPTQTQTPRVPSALEKLLEITPESFAGEPLEFADYAGAASALGFTDYATLDYEARENLLQEQQQKDLFVWRGLPEALSGSALSEDQIGFPPTLAYNLGIWYFAGFGSSIGAAPSSAFLKIQGRYDEQQVDEKLLAFGRNTGGSESGYTKHDYQGVSYYSLYEDNTNSLHYPGRTSVFNRIALVDDWLLAAPSTDLIETLIDRHQGKGDSLMNSDPHRRLADAIGEGILSGAFKHEATIKDPGSSRNYMDLALPIFQKYIDGLDAWQALSNYDLSLTGYRVRNNAEEIVVAIYYPDPSAAQRDKAQLQHRWDTLEVDFQSSSGGDKPLTDACAPFTTEVVRGNDYSMLVGTCPLKRGQFEDILLDNPYLWQAVPHFILYPDLEELKSQQP